jgi:hypothetical protein
VTAPRRIFEADGNWTEEAGELSARVYRLLEPLVRELTGDGISLLDIEHLLTWEVSTVCTHRRIMARVTASGKRAEGL